MVTMGEMAKSRVLAFVKFVAGRRRALTLRLIS
jgi:hypothetical protein